MQALSLPNIDNMQLTKNNLQLRTTIDELRNELRQNELKVGALQRNFESVSTLCLKAENDKKSLHTTNRILTTENKKLTNDIAENMETIKKLQEMINEVDRDRKNFAKGRNEIT